MASWDSSETLGMVKSMLPITLQKKREWIGALLVRKITDDTEAEMRVPKAILYPLGVLTCMLHDISFMVKRPETLQLRSGPLIMSFKPRYNQATIHPENEYDREVEKSPKISLHYAGARRDLPDLPFNIWSLGRTLEESGLYAAWPYIVGTSHQDIIRLGLRHGMREHTNVTINKRAAANATEIHQVAREMYGQPPVKTRMMTASIPTTQFIELGKKMITPWELEPELSDEGLTSR